MITVVHASDLHFGEPYRPDAGDAFLEAARAASPDLVVLSGDLTQRAKIREYRQARAFLERLPDVPRVVTPGNHDVPLYRVWERIFYPYRNYKKYISSELDTVTRIDGLVVVALNSTAPRRAIVNGRIRDRQLAFAARAFQESDPDAARLLVSHHHLAPAPDYEGGTFLPRAPEILDNLNRMGVEMILGGHLHRAYIGNSLDVYPGQDVEHGIVVVQSGTTTSHRGRARESAKNSFNVIRLMEDHLEITHYMYFDDRGSFAPFSMHAFPRREDQYFPTETLRSGVLLDVGEVDRTRADEDVKRP